MHSASTLGRCNRSLHKAGGCVWSGTLDRRRRRTAQFRSAGQVSRLYFCDVRTVPRRTRFVATTQADPNRGHDVRVLEFVLIGSLLAACQSAGSGQKISLAEAEEICTQRATQYASIPRPVRGEGGHINVGLLAETPDSFMVRDFYKSCVYAKSGQRPTEFPDIPVYN